MWKGYKVCYYNIFKVTSLILHRDFSVYVNKDIIAVSYTQFTVWILQQYVCITGRKNEGRLGKPNMEIRINYSIIKD